MSCWATFSHKTPLWRVPMTTPEQLECRSNNAWEDSSCEEFRCHIEERTDRRVVVDGRECFSSAVLVTCQELCCGDLIYRKKADVGDKNKSLSVGSVKKSAGLFTTGSLYEVVLVG